jgi:hypothetical protein
MRTHDGTRGEWSGMHFDRYGSLRLAMNDDAAFFNDEAFVHGQR